MHWSGRTYRLVWTTVSGVVGVLGLVAGLFLVPADLLFPLLFVATLVGLTVAANAWSRPDGTTVSAGLVRCGLIAATVIAAVVACAGYFVLLGSAGLSLLLLLGVTSPPAMRWCGRRLGRGPRTTDLSTNRYPAVTAEADMEHADWLDGAFSSAQARFLMMTAITHHRVSSPIWGADEVRKLHIELAEIEIAATRWIAGLHLSTEWPRTTS